MSEGKSPTTGLRLEREDGSIILVMGAKLAPYMANDEQVDADLAYMNSVLEAAEVAMEKKKNPPAVATAGGLQPTPALRLEVVELPPDREQGAIARIQTKLTQYAADARQSTPADWSQAGVDATYINWLIETDEKRRAHLAQQQAGSQDILMDLGDMTAADLDIALDAEYESMTEDFIQTFNNVVLQGIEPIKGVFSMSQAFAIVLGYALRANMPFALARDMLTQVMKSATASEKMVRVITKQ